MSDQSRTSPRSPDEAPASSPRALATLPVFFKLAGKSALVVGGSDAAAWKAELLAATGANVLVATAEPGDKLREIADRTASITIERRDWTPADLEGAAIAIADLETDEEIARVRAAAKTTGVPVNIVDKPAHSDFQFGAIVERSPLVIGISTDGGAPVFGQALRARIESLLPDGIRQWAQAAKTWRGAVAAMKLDFRSRRRVWEIFAARALKEPDRAPSDDDLAAMRAAAGAGPTEKALGHVSLVGAGPGDPELLTLKAVRALQSADVVLFDDLVSPGVVDMARREARKISVGKRGYKPSCTQEDITAMLTDFAREGKHVVRLKGGDPMVFGRATEEIEALTRAGVPVEIVPGITSASAAAAYLGKSLTERVRARRVQFITAHGRDGKLPDDLDWRALADPRATTVVYMGVRTLQPLADRLILEGLAPDTPAAIVERVGSPGERRILSTVAGLPAAAAQAAIKAPALVIIGWTLVPET